jgi:putative transposase
MKRAKFTEEQIIGILREQEAGAKTADVCRRHGISSATFYAWKSKYGGLEVSEARRLKALEEANAKLERLLADAMLDQAALKDLLSKMYGPPRYCKDDMDDVPACVNVSGL